MFGLLIYNLKVGICLAVFYLFFKGMLSRETFHRMNRIVLLGGTMLSFVLPLCVITLRRELPPLPLFPVGTAVAAPAVAYGTLPPAFPWEATAGWIYAAGIAAAFVRMAGSLWSVQRIIRRGRREPIGAGAVLVHAQRKGTPFSWGRYIVVSESDLTGCRAEVLLHEGAHARLHHTRDLLLFDLACCLQWFNPAVWLLRGALRAVHEYQADEVVLASDVDARHYQLLLVRRAAREREFSVTNSFRSLKLKNRITMMLRSKSSRRAGVKTLLLLPLAGLALGAFAETVYVLPEPEKPERVVVTGMRVSPPGASAHAELPEVRVSSERFDTCRIVSDGAEASAAGGSGHGIVGEAGGASDDAQGTVPDGLQGRIRSVSVFGITASVGADTGKYALQGFPAADKSARIASKNLLLVDGSVYRGDISDIPEEDIEMVSVSRESVGGYDGIVSITTRSAAKHRIGADAAPFAPSSLVLRPDNKSFWDFGRRNSVSAGKMLYVLDGKVISGEEFLQLDQESISTLSVLKDDTAAKKYGRTGYASVVEITTGSVARPKAFTSAMRRGADYLIRAEQAEKGASAANDPVEARRAAAKAEKHYRAALRRFEKAQEVLPEDRGAMLAVRECRSRLQAIASEHAGAGESERVEKFVPVRE